MKYKFPNLIEDEKIKAFNWIKQFWKACDDQEISPDEPVHKQLINESIDRLMELGFFQHHERMPTWEEAEDWIRP